MSDFAILCLQMRLWKQETEKRGKDHTPRKGQHWDLKPESLISGLYEIFFYRSIDQGSEEMAQQLEFFPSLPRVGVGSLVPRLGGSPPPITPAPGELTSYTLLDPVQTQHDFKLYSFLFYLYECLSAYMYAVEASCL